MLALASSLALVALLDSLSIIPLCIVFLIVLLAGPHPVVRSSAFLFGVFVSYLAAGVLVMLGLQEIFDEVNAYLVRLWKSPYTEELLLQIVLGAVLVAFGWRLAIRRAKHAGEPTAEAMTARQAWLAGIGLTIAGLPGAVPYLAAIDMVLRTDLPSTQRLILITWYNVVFVAPLAGIVALRQAFGGGADSFIDAIRRFLDRWGPRLIVVLLLAFGIVLVADGIGWFLGHPLIPIG